ncbi:MAG: complex I NDUFA9 subunit family protein [Thermoleophilia bacterium]
MKVFITGATGFVGKHLARRLIDGGHQLKCLATSTSGADADLLRTMGAEVVTGDILDAASVADAAAGSEVVIHLVGIIFERRGATFEEIHVNGTMNALAAASVAGARQYIHMSALGTGPDAGSAYFQTKWAAEERVRASGLDYTIFRPSTIIGPGGEFINMLMGQVRRTPFIPVIGNGNYLMQPVSVFDVAACFTNSINNPRAINQVFELGGPDQMTYNEMMETIFRVMGKRRIRTHIPVFMVKPVAYIGERLMSKPLLTTDQLKMLLKDNVCDITRIREELGVEPEPFETAVRAAIA